MTNRAGGPPGLRRLALGTLLTAGSLALLVAPVHADGICVAGALCVSLSPPPVPISAPALPSGTTPTPSAIPAPALIPGAVQVTLPGGSPSQPAPPGGAVPVLPRATVAGPAQPATNPAAGAASRPGETVPAARGPAPVGALLSPVATPGGSSTAAAPGVATLALAPPPAVTQLGPASGLSFGHAPFLWPALLVLNVAALLILVILVRRTWASPG